MDEITTEMIKNWLGNDWSFSEICEIFAELANNEYCQVQMREDILSSQND